MCVYDTSFLRSHYKETTFFHELFYRTTSRIFRLGEMQWEYEPKASASAVFPILSSFDKTLQKHRRIFRYLFSKKIRGKDMISILISKCKLSQGSAKS